MKKTLLVIFIFNVQLILVAQSENDINQQIELDIVVEEINKSLLIAQNSLSGMKLLSADISIEAIKSYNASGKGSFIVKAGYAWEQQNTITLVYSFALPERSSSAIIFSESELSTQLAKLIEEASNQIQESQEEIQGLVLQGFTVVLNFYVRKKSNGGIEFNIFGAGIKAGGSYSKANSHSIALTFEKTCTDIYPEVPSLFREEH